MNAIEINKEEDMNDDWVLIEPPRITLFERCKQRGYKLLRYYRKMLLVYRVYRIVRVCINLYILYHTLMPGQFPPF